MNSQPTTKTYGAIELTGRQAKDKLCLELNSCYDVDFLYVDSSTGNSNINVDGIIGLARPNKPIKLNPSLTPNSDTFMLSAMAEDQRTWSTLYSHQ